MGRSMAQARPASRTNKERRQDSDNRMVQAAINLFAARGYQKTTLVQVGQEAGCTGTLVSNRFGSKEGLLRAVLAHILSRFVEDGEAQQQQTEKMQAVLQDPSAALKSETGRAKQPFPPDGNAIDYMNAFVATYLKDVVEKQSRIRALYVIMGEALGAIPEIEDDLVKVNVVFRNRVASYVNLGIETGEFNADLDPGLSAVIIVGLLRGVTMQLLAEPDNFDLKTIIPATQASVIATLVVRD